MQVQSLGREDLLERGMATHPVPPGESHGQRGWNLKQFSTHTHTRSGMQVLGVEPSTILC